MASYPSATKSFTTKVDGAGNTILAAYVNDLQDEVVAIENGLRTGLAHVLQPTVAGAQDLGSPSLPWGNAYVTGLPMDIGLCEGRLTLTSGTAVTTADVTGAGTLYFTPFHGNRVALFDGSAWALYTFTELSLVLTLTSGKPYDVFLYNNSGTLTLETLVWTNDTTRATALALQHGVYVKSGATTRRYLGTLYASGANTTEDSAAKMYLWNYYNRMPRHGRVADATASWAYTTATWRQANAAAANQVDLVVGVSDSPVWVTVWAAALNATQVYLNVAVAEDSATVPTITAGGLTGGLAGGFIVPITAVLVKVPAVGRHYYAWLEASQAAGTTNWYGTNTTLGGNSQTSAITAQWWH